MHIKEFTRRRGVIAREVSPGLSRDSPQRPPPLPTAAGPEPVKSREGALVPVPFLLGRQPEPEPGKAAAEHMGPEATAPPSPPRRVGRQQQRWESDGKQVAARSTKGGELMVRELAKGQADPDVWVPGV